MQADRPVQRTGRNPGPIELAVSRYGLLVVCRSTVVVCCCGMTGAVVSVVTVRVVVVAGSLPQADKAPTESESARQVAKPAIRGAEFFSVIILKPFLIVYFVKSNLASAEMFQGR
ncbi:MAG: hypothetical protein JWM91_1645 [Rhodospirillales bacterium]|nr:hypothetical protein [Rhodospirillales bacterium]